MKLKECIDTIIDNRGKNPKYYDNEKYPVIDNVMIKNNYHPNINEATRFIDQETHDKFLRGYLEPDLPIMTLVGSGIGNVSLSIDNKSVIVQNTIGFKTNKKLNSVYLYYWFLSKHDDLKKFNRGSGQPSIKKTDIENMEIDLPEIEYQKRVVKLLSTIDKLIEINNRNNIILYDIGKCLFHEYFENIKFKDNYNHKLLNEVTCNNRKKIDKEMKYKVLSAVNTGELVLSDDYFDKKVYSENLDKYIDVPMQSFAYNPARINIGSIGLNKYDFPCCVSPVYVSFSVDEKYVDFFNYYFRSNNFKSQVNLRASGSVRQTLNYSDFGLIEIDYPDISLVDRFNELYSVIKKRIDSNNDKVLYLNNLKNLLLPQLMKGEIDLNNIEI